MTEEQRQRLAALKAQVKNKQPDMTDKIIVTTYTDPACIWCWRMEPVLRRLEAHWGDQWIIRTVMGGMSPETHPLNIAVKAAQKVDASKADAFLYNLRAAHFVEDRELYQIDVLEEIVQESGLDINAFHSYMDDGSAQKAFIGDLYLAGEAEVTSFPTFSIKYNQKTFILRGFVEFDVFMEAILEIMGRVIMPRFPKVTDQDFLDMLAKHPRMSREEIESAFNFSKDEPMEKFLNRLLEEGRIQKTNFETTFFVSCI